MEMSIRIEVRINEETLSKIEKIIEKKNSLYPNKSQLIRSAIHYLYNKEVKNEG